MADPVVCHSGSQYAEYPQAFEFQGDNLPVDELLARWRTPAGKCFRVRAACAVFDLYYDEAHDGWRVEQLSTQISASQHDEETA
jgi:hypothetical protein